LARGAELTAVRDNLRHASISTTSVYLHSDEVKRAKQIREAFAARRAFQQLNCAEMLKRVLCSDIGHAPAYGP
jgi:hypothetical protein